MATNANKLRSLQTTNLCPEYVLNDNEEGEGHDGDDVVAPAKPAWRRKQRLLQPWLLSFIFQSQLFAEFCQHSARYSCLHGALVRKIRRYSLFPNTLDAAGCRHSPDSSPHLAQGAPMR